MRMDFNNINNRIPNMTVSILYLDDTDIALIHALKILDKYDVKAVLALDLHNKSSVRRLTSFIAEGVHEIASHSYTHRPLTKLSPKELYTEIYMSKKYLENMFKRKIITFVYPYGIYSQDAVNLLKKSGYLFARTTEQFNIKLDLTNRFKHGVALCDYYPKFIDYPKYIINKIDMLNYIITSFEFKLRKINPFIFILRFLENFYETRKKELTNGNNVIMLVMHPNLIKHYSAWSTFEEIINFLSSNTSMLTVRDLLMP